ncbi:unnamed protein product [Arctogadus glacialis]
MRAVSYPLALSASTCVMGARGRAASLFMAVPIYHSAERKIDDGWAGRSGGLSVCERHSLTCTAHNSKTTQSICLPGQTRRCLTLPPPAVKNNTTPDSLLTELGAGEDKSRGFFQAQSLALSRK